MQLYRYKMYLVSVHDDRIEMGHKDLTSRALRDLYVRDEYEWISFNVFKELALSAFDTYTRNRHFKYKVDDKHDAKLMIGEYGIISPNHFIVYDRYLKVNEVEFDVVRKDIIDHIDSTNPILHNESYVYSCM